HHSRRRDGARRSSVRLRLRGRKWKEHRKRWFRRTRSCLSGGGCGACVADCWTSRLVVVGPPWRVSLDNPSCRTFYKEPASNGNSSTITTVREQCQTPNPAHVTSMFQRYSFRTNAHLLPCPCYGLSMDAVALCVRLRHRKN